MSSHKTEKLHKNHLFTACGSICNDSFISTINDLRVQSKCAHRKYLIFKNVLVILDLFFLLYITVHYSKTRIIRCHIECENRQIIEYQYIIKPNMICNIVNFEINQINIQMLSWLKKSYRPLPTVFINFFFFNI